MNQARALLSIGVALMGASATATSVVAQSLEQMATTAPIIVRARVVRVEASWDSHRRRIYTYAEVQVLEAIKGAPRDALLVRQPGGVVGELGQRIDGVAAFREGAESVLFLHPVPDEAAVYGVWSFAAGKIDLELRPGGQRRAVRHLDGLAFFKPAERGRPQIERLGAEDLGPADELVSRVRAAARGGGR